LLCMRYVIACDSCWLVEVYTLPHSLAKQEINTHACKSEAYSIS
jgi:hypothetical protein